MSIAVARATTPTSSGTVDLTVPGFGTPTGVILFLFWGDTDGTPRNNDVYASWGATDGTNQRSVAISDIDGLASSDADRTMRADRCLIGKTVTTAIQQSATFNAWITDGVRLNWSTSDSSQMTIVAVLFKGNFAVGSLTPNSTQNGTASISGLSFGPTCLFVGTNGGTFTTTGGNESHAILTFGCAVKTGASSKHRATMYSSENGQANMDCDVLVSTQYACGQQFNGVLSWAIEITGWASDGFTATTRVGGSGGDETFYVAWDGDGKSLDLLTVDSPTTAGTKKYSTSFAVEAILGSFTDRTAVDSIGACDTFGFFAGDGTSEYSLSGGNADAAADSWCHNLSDSKIVNAHQSDSGTTTAQLLAATVDSYDADGVTFNWTVVDASARYGWMLAVGADAGGGTNRRRRLLIAS